MLGQLNDSLAALGSFAYPIGWLTLAVFLVAIAFEYYDRERSRPVFALGWLLFGLFWVSLLQPYFVVEDSFVKGIGALVAVPCDHVHGTDLRAVSAHYAVA
jgi:hypothetical protein